MTYFSKKNKLHLMMTIGILTVFSTELSAECDVAQALHHAQTHPPTACGGPLAPHESPVDKCIDCLSDIYRACIALGMPFSDALHTRYYNRCLTLQGSQNKNKKMSTPQKSHTP